MRADRLRTWQRWHSWSSLLCTLLLLLICLTGLPLIFSDEIDAWLDHDAAYAQVAAGTPAVNLDNVAASARSRYPGQIISSIFVDDDEPQIVVAMAPSWAQLQRDPRLRHTIKFDAHTGIMLSESERDASFLQLMLALHRELLAGAPGMLLMGLMALLFVIASVSGVVLYAPYTGKLQFGSIRTEKAKRLRWLDIHNLLGIVTVSWLLVLGLTGILNELSTPLFSLWQKTEVQPLLQHWQGQLPVSATQLSSVQAAFDTARQAMPGMQAISIVYPGNQVGSPNHYLVWAKGNSALTSRLFMPALIDARSGALSAVMQMPWYLRALEVSRPLHFGDYGGLPLKLLWALFDLLTIVILFSGLYLWGVRKLAERRAIA